MSLRALIIYFFSCSFARFLWNVICGTLGNPKLPLSFFDLCQNWIPSYSGKDRAIVSIGAAALIWTIWKTKNKSCFQRVFISNPINVIFTLCSLLDSWMILQRKGVQKMLREVSKRLSRVANEVYRRTYGWNPSAQRLCFLSTCLLFWLMCKL